MGHLAITQVAMNWTYTIFHKKLRSVTSNVTLAMCIGTGAYVTVLLYLHYTSVFVTSSKASDQYIESEIFVSNYVL
jgi:site-specific recombinase